MAFAARPTGVLLSAQRASGVVCQPPSAVWGALLPRQQQQQQQQLLRLCASKHSEPRSQPEVYVGLPSSEPEGTQQYPAFTTLGVMPGFGSGAAAAALAACAVLLTAAGPAAAAVEGLPSLQDLVGGVEQLVQDSGILGPLVFTAAYIVATVFLVPASVLTLAAGFLFGPVLGTAVVSVASTSGAAAAFLVGRYFARPAVERRIQGNPRFAAVDGAIGRQGARIVLLLRLSPLFPFTLLNYALSLTQIEFGPYVLASWAGMLPGTAAYVALGGAGKAAAESAAGAGVGPLQLALYAVGAGATLWATALISKAASKALQEAEAEAPEQRR